MSRTCGYTVPTTTSQKCDFLSLLYRIGTDALVNQVGTMNAFVVFKQADGSTCMFYFRCSAD